MFEPQIVPDPQFHDIEPLFIGLVCAHDLAVDSELYSSLLHRGALSTAPSPDEDQGHLVYRLEITQRAYHDVAGGRDLKGREKKNRHGWNSQPDIANAPL